MSGREETQERPRRLARQRVTAAFLFGIVVGCQRLAPTSVWILSAQQPLDRALDIALSAVLADGAEPAQHRPGPVDVIRAPSAVPRAIFGLRAPYEVQRGS